MNIQATFFLFLMTVSNLWSQNAPDQAAKVGFLAYLEVAKANPNVFPLLTENAILGQAMPLTTTPESSDPQFLYSIETTKGIVMLLRVVQSNGDWQAQELGYEDLAREISIVRQSWPASDGYSLKISLQTEEKSFYFTIPEVKRPNLTPITYGAAEFIPEAKYSKLETNKEN